MLMAHSVEGRFPFLDADVMDFCNSLPPEYKLAGLNEKFILKSIARGIIPDDIVNRQKQPYRAPDAVSFVGAAAPAYVAEMLGEPALASSGLFDVAAVRNLYAKCDERARKPGNEITFSNTDNMALVGILSTQLLYDQCVLQHDRPSAAGIEFTTCVDRLPVASH